MIYVDIRKTETISFPIWQDVNLTVLMTIIDANTQVDDIIDCVESAEDTIDGGMAELVEDANTLQLVVKEGNRVVFQSTAVPLDSNIRDVDFEWYYKVPGNYTAELYQGGVIIGRSEVRITDGETGCHEKYIVYE